MGCWALLPKGIDLPCYEAGQDRENQRNPIGLMCRLRSLLSSRYGLICRFSVAFATAHKTFMEEILDPQGLRKMVCECTGDSLSRRPATLLLLLSEVPRQHGRGTRRLAEHPVQVHGKRDEAGFLRLTRLPIMGKIQCIALDCTTPRQR